MPHIAEKLHFQNWRLAEKTQSRFKSQTTKLKAVVGEAEGLRESRDAALLEAEATRELLVVTEAELERAQATVDQVMSGDGVFEVELKHYLVRYDDLDIDRSSASPGSTPPV